jgi:hypothetical protein
MVLLKDCWRCQFTPSLNVQGIQDRLTSQESKAGAQDHEIAHLLCPLDLKLMSNVNLI